MSLLSTLNKLLPETKGYQPTGGMTVYQTPDPFQPRIIGGTGFNDVKMYPQDDGTTYIDKGYKRNGDVYTIVNKCAKKFSQVPWYLYKIKRTERKALLEYKELTSHGLTSVKDVLESKKMLKKAVDENVIDHALTKKLMQPNRYQSRARFMEQWYGYRLLTGEGNFIKNRGVDERGRYNTEGKPLELLLIPKKQLLHVGDGRDPFEIKRWVFQVMGSDIIIEKENIINWSTSNYDFDDVTLSHLRGMSPLEPFLLRLQADNEGAERLVKMNKNQGAAGLLYDKTPRQQTLTPAQATEMRRQVNGAVNSSEMAGSIAWLGGEYGYIQFGLDANQLRLLEQADVSFEKLCNIFDVPVGLFLKDQTYENKKEDRRSFIYENIAVACVGARDELNSNLLEDFDLDRNEYFLDFDIMALPEIGQELKDKVSALKDASFLTENEKRLEAGYEPILDPVMDLTQLQIGQQEAQIIRESSLDEEEQLLNNV